MKLVKISTGWINMEATKRIVVIEPGVAGNASVRVNIWFGSKAKNFDSYTGVDADAIIAACESEQWVTTVSLT